MPTLSRGKRKGTVGGLDAPWNQNESIPDGTSLLRGSVKRRKTDGMNSRFDRMIATANIVPTPRPSRKRSRASSSASGSSSTVSYDIPKTPLDAYNDLEGGRLGEDFAILRMKQDTRDGTMIPTFNPAYFHHASNDNQPTVPAWLSDAMSTVGAQHPIRALVPAVKPPGPLTPKSNSLLLVPAPPPQTLPHVVPTTDDDPDLFAFRAPSRGHESQVTHYDAAAQNYIRESPPMVARAIVTPGLPARPLHPSPPRPSSLRQVQATTHSILPQIANSPSASLLPNSSDLSSPTQAYHYTTPGLVPFSAPGPFATDASRMPTLTTGGAPPSRFRASSVFDAPAVSCAQSADESMVDTVLPFSTPGPLARGDVSRSPHAPNRIWHTLQRPVVSRETPFGEVAVEQRTHEASPVKSPVTPETSSAFSRYGSLTRFTPQARRIYFDSPAKDPIGSDPLEPAEYELELDYEHLDFRWERFDPSGNNLKHVVSSVRPVHRIIDDDGTIEGNADEAPPSQECPQQDTCDGNQQSQSSFSSQLSSATDAHIRAATPGNQVIQEDALTMANAEPETYLPPGSPPRGPSFAPAPGIYVSPLRGDALSGQEEGTEESGHQDENVPPDEIKDEHVNADSLPRTPVQRNTNCAPKTPSAPRHGAVLTSLSVPQIAVLYPEKEGLADEIEDSEVEMGSLPVGKESQDSHDSIESWSAG